MFQWSGYMNNQLSIKWKKRSEINSYASKICRKLVGNNCQLSYLSIFYDLLTIVIYIIFINQWFNWY